MKKHLGKLCIIILFLAGFSLLLYPFVANQWNNYRQKKLINNYEQTVAGMEAAGEIDYDAEWAAARAYNKALLPSILPDSFADAAASEEDGVYMSCLNVGGNGVMGTVEIPKINITIPIFHTTNEDVLQTAAGHLEGSSLPVSGEDSHVVISAHRGLPSAALFTDLDKMEKGDHFLLHILNEIFCYEIDKISVVEPENTKDLEVEYGEDLVTLLTCTPYGVNSHRLLVRGHRVPYEPEKVADEKVPFSNMSLHTNYLLWVVVGIGITLVFSFVLYRREKRLRAKTAKVQAEEQKILPEGEKISEEILSPEGKESEEIILEETGLPEDEGLPEEILPDPEEKVTEKEQP
ncbi:MAG: class C sortase [Lachnospiraceae bacterium]|nr:class C sortase [Lachnospiraceae bacterium]